MSTSIHSTSIHRHKAHYLPLDSVRGLAASCVVVHHFVISAAFVTIFPNKAWIDVAFFHNAWLFVDLFFVLSGIVISLNYTRSDFGVFSFRDFVVRRLARIYPLHIVTLFAALMFRLLKLGVVAFGLLQVAPAEMQVNNVYSFFVNVFLLHALGFVDYLSWNAPSWSISAEFYTYLIFGAVLVFAQWRGNVRIVYMLSALLMLASVLIMVFVMRRTSIDFHYAFGIVRCVFSFFLGVLTVRIVASLPDRVRPAIQTIVQFVSVAAAIVVMSLVAMMPQISFVAPFIFAALLGALMAFPNRALPNILSVGPLVWLGKRSYSIYMVHSLVLMLFEYFVRAIGTKRIQVIDGLAPGLAETGLLLAFVATVFAVSNLTYLHVELPGSKAVLRFFNRAPGEKLASAHGGAISQ